MFNANQTSIKSVLFALRLSLDGFLLLWGTWISWWFCSHRCYRQGFLQIIN